MTDIDPAAYRAIAAALAKACGTPDDVWRREYMDTAFQATPDDSAVEDAVALLDELRDKYDMGRRGVTWLMQAVLLRLLVEARDAELAALIVTNAMDYTREIGHVAVTWLAEVAHGT